MRYTKAIIASAVAGVAIASVAVINQVTAANNTPSSLVPITPCRLLDTRAESPVGEHPGALTNV